MNGVLAGTGARDFETTLAAVGKLQQRGFFGLIIKELAHSGVRREVLRSVAAVGRRRTLCA